MSRFFDWDISTSDTVGPLANAVAAQKANASKHFFIPFPPFT